MLGKIAKTSFERCLGTLVGGWLGCACFLVSRHPAWVACISFALAIASSMLAVKLKLDYSCKLLSITFILGAHPATCQTYQYPQCMASFNSVTHLYYTVYFECFYSECNQ